ncbi:MAG: AsmA family protein [Planctomycetota bacterium]|nr:MAG: AsmA family protein [Planctomycetota bacterium]
MKKALQVVRVILLAIVILVVVVVVAINIFAERALKMSIEAAATKTLNVGVSVGNIDLSIMGGKLGISNLLISNPPGYQHDRLLELKDAQIEVNVRSLLGDTVNIKQLKLDGLRIVLEQRGISGNNFEDVIKTIAAKPKAEAGSGEPGKKLRIDNLEISNVTVDVKLLPVPGRADTVTLKLSPIRMTDLGGDDKLDTAVLSAVILLAITNGIAEQGAGVLPKEMVRTMRLTLDRTLDLGKTAAKESEKLLKESKDVGEKLMKDFEGLLKPKEKE